VVGDRGGDGVVYGNVTTYGTMNQGGTHTHYGTDEPSRRGSFPEPEDQAEASFADRSRNVFVVYGRDEQARRAVFELLRSLDLRPLEWEPLVRATGEGTPFLGRVVADAPSLVQAQAALVVLTPDDIVLLHPDLRSTREDPHELQPSLQPRPNVLLELGMMLALYPRSTIILEFGDLRQVADLAGRNVIRFNEAVSLPEVLRKIAGRLEEAGCPVDDTGADWLDVRPFARLMAYRRRAR
jgi:predicted nucleotide-binding protein